MTDIAQLEKDLLAAVAAAKDEAALEAVRISALGKSGSVSTLLKTLGTMTRDRTKAARPRNKWIERPRYGRNRYGKGRIRSSHA